MNQSVFQLLKGCLGVWKLLHLPEFLIRNTLTSCSHPDLPLGRTEPYLPLFPLLEWALLTCSWNNSALGAQHYWKAQLSEGYDSCQGARHSSAFLPQVTTVPPAAMQKCMWLWPYLVVPSHSTCASGAGPSNNKGCCLTIHATQHSTKLLSCLTPVWERKRDWESLCHSLFPLHSAELLFVRQKCSVEGFKEYEQPDCCLYPFFIKHVRILGNTSCWPSPKGSPKSKEAGKTSLRASACIFNSGVAAGAQGNASISHENSLVNTETQAFRSCRRRNWIWQRGPVKCGLFYPLLSLFYST